MKISHNIAEGMLNLLKYRSSMVNPVAVMALLLMSFLYCC